MLSNLLTIANKTHPQEALTEESITGVEQAAAKRRAAADQANHRGSENAWSQELSELKMRFEVSGIRSVSDTKAQADAEVGAATAIFNGIEAEIAEGQKVLEIPYLDQYDKATIRKKIERLEHALVQAKENRERIIRVCGGRVRDAKTWAPSRPRYEELKKREREIDAVTRNI